MMWLKCMCDDTGRVPSVAVTTRIKYGAKFSLHLLTILVEERFGGYSVVDIFSDKDCTINITLFMNNVCFCSSCIKSSFKLGGHERYMFMLYNVDSTLFCIMDFLLNT